MTIYPGKELQIAIYTALNADGTLGGLIDSIYDNVPDNAVFPYLVIGEFTSVTFDDKTSNGTNTTVTLHAFTQDRDKHLVHDILARTYDLLHTVELSVTGQTLIELRSDNFLQVFQENTGNNTTYHGVVRYRALTREL